MKFLFMVGSLLLATSVLKAQPFVELSLKTSTDVDGGYKYKKRAGLHCGFRVNSKTSYHKTDETFVNDFDIDLLGDGGKSQESGVIVSTMNGARVKDEMKGLTAIARSNEAEAKILTSESGVSMIEIRLIDFQGKSSISDDYSSTCREKHSELQLHNHQVDGAITVGMIMPPRVRSRGFIGSISY